MAVAQLLPDEDGARKGSALVHGAAAVQLVHARELDDIAERDTLPLQTVQELVQSEPAEAARTVRMIPYGRDLLPSAIASTVLKVVCLDTDASGRFSDFVIALARHQKTSNHQDSIVQLKVKVRLKHSL